MFFRIWSEWTHTEYSEVQVTYSMGSPGNYSVNGIYIVSSLHVLGTHTITATATPHGSITPVGQVIVPNGMSQTFTITPDSGYQTSSLVVDGVPIIPPPLNYTFEDVSANHTIDVVFGQIPTTVVEDAIDVRQRPAYVLEQNYPNPFNPATEIKYDISEVNRVTLKVFDVLGKEVATLVDEVQHSGKHLSRWDASGLPSGVYFYTLQTPKASVTKNMILAK